MKQDNQYFYPSVFITHLIMSLFLLLLFSCGKDRQDSQGDNKLVILHAGSLSVPFKEMSKAFKGKNPGIEILLEGHGSRTCARHISELGKKVDIFGSADSSVIKNLLIPEYAKFVIDFATNEMVVAYTKKSLFLKEINSTNWYNILLRDKVEVGHSDPNTDPCGYRAVLTCMLAENYYQEKGLYKRLNDKIPKRNIRPKEVDLLAILEIGELDYIFIYKSVALQHALQYITLPPQVNLSSTEFINLYQSVSTEITGKKPGEMMVKKGEAMVYGLTIPDNAPNKKLAAVFLNFILSEEGRDIMKKNGQGIIFPPRIKNLSNLPLGVVINK